jgi:hypothetical protein
VTTTAPEGGAPFTAETFQNQYLAAGADTVDAVVTVRATAAPGAAPILAGQRAEVIVIDASGSMGANRKMAAAIEAARAAIDCLEDGVSFAIVAGNH